MAIAAAIAFVGSFVLPVVVRPSNKQGGRPQRREHLDRPSIDVIVPAYLEASIIGQKIADLQHALASTSGDTNIIVVASDPATAVAARSNGAAMVIETGRQGKSSAINEGVARSNAEIIVLTDANCSIEPATWPAEVVRSLADADLVTAKKQESGSSESAFKYVENWLSRSSERGGTSVAVYGEFVAMRRTDFRPIKIGVILDDVALSLDFGMRGLRTTVTPGIHTLELAPSAREQWQRRVRITEGLLAETLPSTFSLLRFAAGRAFIARKLYRVTFGCVGFWTAIVGASIAVPPIAAPIGALMALGISNYAGLLKLPRQVEHALAPLGMQAVPVAAAIRVLRRGRSDSQGGALWHKIER